MAEYTGKLIIITAPSGAGKTSVTKYLLDKIPQLAFSVSATTRKPRSNETNGVDYYFITEEDFHNKIQDDDFLEWEMVYEGKFYGTFRSELGRMWNENKVPLLDIDVKGAIHVFEQFDENCLTIFIEPPSVEELKRRLSSRGTESLESLQTRLNKAVFELSFKQQFNKIIINDKLEDACKEAEAAVKNFLGL
ncbi:guanylate kinase [Parafilimonas terrae]|uniref:Guanylate kinase n=1 Tax=Parafilimonas terrae TaxID=1465490 RepID=A0A1I5V5H7_9BACT|nr:guanylate kinase [Parafilimonas terrae]SFQ02701.1 guanylate kinase [Parafilimonas terrae]